jgi:hypothetical protein
VLQPLSAPSFTYKPSNSASIFYAMHSMALLNKASRCRYSHISDISLTHYKGASLTNFTGNAPMGLKMRYILEDTFCYHLA